MVDVFMFGRRLLKTSIVDLLMFGYVAARQH